LGLEFLKKKEETGKELYSTFSKGMISNVYNTETLKQDIKTSKDETKRLTDEITDSETKIEDVDKRLQKGQEYKDGLLNAKHADINHDLITINPDRLKEEIISQKLKIVETEKQIKEVKVVEPKEFYHEDKHDGVKDEMKTVNGELVVAQNKVEEIEELIKKYGDGIQCEHCGIKLMEAALTKKKIDELSDWEKKVDKLSKKWKDLDIKEKSYTQLKKDFDEYERNKLIKEKHELSLESQTMKLGQLETKLGDYEAVQEKIKKNNEIDAQIIKANLRIDDLINEKRGYERIQSQNQVKIDQLQAKIEKNQDFILQIAEEFEKEKVYKLYLEVFGKNGITKLIMKTMMPLINQELQRLLQDSCYFNLEIRVNDKNEVEFIMIDNSTGIEKLMTSGSGYERTIAAMALRAVLSKVCSLPKPNVSVWDETFGKISNENLEMVGEFFIKMKDYFEKIFVISHNPLISNWGNNIVTIKKTNNVSKVSQ
jgi:DNA repair exonuclease SbcCD ATPase subunit